MFFDYHFLCSTVRSGSRPQFSRLTSLRASPPLAQVEPSSVPPAQMGRSELGVSENNGTNSDIFATTMTVGVLNPKWNIAFVIYRFHLSIDS